MASKGKYIPVWSQNLDGTNSWKPWNDFQRTWPIIHITFLYLLLLFLLFRNFHGSCNLTTKGSRDPNQSIYSPAQGVVDYEINVFPENILHKSPYMTSEDGFPSNETDELWHELYKYGIVEITAEEALNLPNNTAELPHKPNSYVVEIDVFHQLHCLNYIRKGLYPDRYMQDFRDAYDEHGRRNYFGHDARHYDHCIDSIRLAIMCHADISTIPWLYDPTKGYPAPRLEVAHTCRNFNTLLDWAKDRAVPDDNYSLEWLPGSEDDFKSLGGVVVFEV